MQGLESRVAFKANETPDFLSLSKEIYWVDGKKQKDHLLRRCTRWNGLFSAATNAYGETYKAVWKASKGVAHENDLPAAKTSGVTLSVNNDNTNIAFTISRPEDAPADMRAFHVVAQMQQQTICTARINMNTKTTVTAPIPAADLPDGIVQITLFTEARQPVAERIVFFL